MIVAIPIVALIVALTSASSPQNNIDGNRWYTQSGPSSSLLNKRNTPRQGKSYEDDAIPTADQKSVDLHNGEFCVDVSTFGPVEYDTSPIEVCDSTFAKKCEERYEQVCDDVTEIVCEIVPYTVCEMLMESVPYRSFEVVQKLSKKKVCTTGTDIVKHTKLMPECHEVTKQNCITKWETDENGKQVWAGNEACEPVTWRECELVPKQVDFKVPKIECGDGEDIVNDDFIDVEKNQMTSRMACKVEHTTSCEPKVTNKCQQIEFQECNEVPTEKCDTKYLKVPKQELEHKKKCLLADDDTLPSTSTPAPTAYPAPSQAPQPTYPAAPLPQSTPASKPTYIPAPKPSYTPAPQPSYQPQRTGRLNNQSFGQRQPTNSGFGRRQKSFRQQSNTQSFQGRFQG